MSSILVLGSRGSRRGASVSCKGKLYAPWLCGWRQSLGFSVSDGSGVGFLLSQQDILAESARTRCLETVPLLLRASGRPWRLGFLETRHVFDRFASRRDLATHQTSEVGSRSD